MGASKFTREANTEFLSCFLRRVLAAKASLEKLRAKLGAAVAGKGNAAGALQLSRQTIRSMTC